MISWIIAGLVLVSLGWLIYLLRRYRQFRVRHDRMQYELYIIGVDAINKLGQQLDLPYDTVVQAMNVARETYNESLLLKSTPRLPLMEVPKVEKKDE